MSSSDAPDHAPAPSPSPSAVTAEAPGAVAVVVIAYDDVALVGEAVASALAQGPAVTEVIAVDDASSDGTGELLERLAADEPRLRVVRRRENSGGCGTPRNDGIEASTAPYLMFLDSDDVLEPGAATALLAAARAADAPVAVGACVRRELPQGADSPWVPGLYRGSEVIERPSERPELVRDTLCVNKLYAREFLDAHEIRFPQGRFVYEDFVFTALVLAAAPRLAVVPDPVYVWHVRRTEDQVSISLDRDLDNWRARIRAHERAAEILTKADPLLGRAARAKFLDVDLRMYLRELAAERDRQASWWRVTREYTTGFPAAESATAGAAGQWIAALLAACEELPSAADVSRLRALAARPARLLPPYARDAEGRPVWSTALPVPEPPALAALPPAALPVSADAEGCKRGLRVRVRDQYGRLAAAHPRRVFLRSVPRAGGDPVDGESAALRPEPGEGAWTAELPFNMRPLAVAGRRRGRRGLQGWEVRLVVVFDPPRGARGPDRSEPVATGAPGDQGRAGSGTEPLVVGLRPLGGLLRRRVLPDSRYGVLLAQPFRTASGTLGLRLAPGKTGALNLLRNRLHRLRVHLRRRLRP
ncbi:glycosyltransferase family 2 protein [Streptomyces sp. BI20]|uniref:glycosyltransferase family 2 protein n=1 Tax=Streptomyces sp. BI20 TaxID=3403460 RepID=UPI003C74AB66